MASYVHQQLPDAEKYLRILTLEGGKFDDALEATLSVERFDSKPSYEALSYVCKWIWFPYQSKKH